MREVVLMGLLLGVGAALSVGPVFVIIIREAVANGFRSSFLVILGSAVADLLLLIPALACGWIIGQFAHAAFWVALAGAAFFIYLSIEALREARKLWSGDAAAPSAGTWSFWKGVGANLANPLTWTFWLLTGTPMLHRSLELAGTPGLIAFTATWFAVACGVEALIALIAVRTGRLATPRGLAVFNGLSAVTFLILAGTMIVHAR